MNTKKTIPFLLLLLALACNDDDKLIKMRVNHYYQPHYQYYQCPGSELPMEPSLYVQEGNSIGGKDWVGSSYVEGFVPEMGYIIDILVKIEETGPREYESGHIFTQKILVKYLSRKKVPDTATFEIHLSAVNHEGCFNSAVLVKKTADLPSRFSLLHDNASLPEISIDCGTLCNELSEKLSDRKTLDGAFTHIPGGVKLVELKTL
jgi:hypothetical protein